MVAIQIKPERISEIVWTKGGRVRHLNPGIIKMKRFAWLTESVCRCGGTMHDTVVVIATGILSIAIERVKGDQPIGRSLTERRRYTEQKKE